MERWLTTTQAAALLGVTATTVRSLAAHGELVHKIDERPQRKRWLVSERSCHTVLAERGHLGRRRPTDLKAQDESSAAAGVAAALQAVAGERDRLRDENASLRDVALLLRARNDAVTSAEQHQARAAELLLQAMQEQAAAAQDLRSALGYQDDALGQLLTPGAADLPSRP